MTSMSCASSWGRRGLLRIELDDELLADGHVDVLPERQIANRDLRAAVGSLEPRRYLAVDRLEVGRDDAHRPGLGAQGDDVAPPGLEARDRDPAPVDVDVAVADELAGLGPARAPPGAVDDVVEAQLEHAQQVLAGDALLAV